MMKVCQLSLICLCLFGATQLAWSQAKEPVAPTIRGYLNPANGKFTTRIPTSSNGASGAPLPESTTQTGTSLFFREEFQITVNNYDQPSNSTAVCSVSMFEVGDANGTFEEELSVTAKATGSGWTCDAPVLTQWVLQTPSTDNIEADVTIYIYSSSTNTTTAVPIGRSSTKSYTLAVPGNTQSIVNPVSFQL